LLNVPRPFDEEAAPGWSCDDSPSCGHASTVPRRRDGYRCAPPILVWGLGCQEALWDWRGDTWPHPGADRPP